MIPILGTFTEYLARIDHWLIVTLSWVTVVAVLLYNIIGPRIKTQRLKKMIANSPNPRQNTNSDNTSSNDVNHGQSL